MRIASKFIKTPLIFLIRSYQTFISSWLGEHCRFYPSCSAWALEALENEGVPKGLLLSFQRLLRCHPLNPGGYEPFVKSKQVLIHG